MARPILGSARDVSFADLGTNAEFRAACVEAGLTHLAGPMLGDVRADGVRPCAKEAFGELVAAKQARRVAAEGGPR